ncbi:hypothetical protein GCM10027067_17470 [Pseudactinotalea suaedae]
MTTNSITARTVTCLGSSARSTTARAGVVTLRGVVLGLRTGLLGAADPRAGREVARTVLAGLRAVAVDAAVRAALARGATGRRELTAPVSLTPAPNPGRQGVARRGHTCPRRHPPPPDHVAVTSSAQPGTFAPGTGPLVDLRSRT